MTKGIRFQLLGSPHIFLDDKEQFFAFAKANALLYYLVVNGSVSREVAASLLWENKNTQTAKKNLRNAIYQVNKVLQADVIICPNRNLLVLNKTLDIKTDINLFLADPLAHLELYQGEFLQGFYLKSGEEFDLWVSKMRMQYEQVYLKACYQKIEEKLSLDAIEDVEEHLKQLIERDEFEEKNYQLLMRLYQQGNCPGKVIETYYQLANVLDKELGIQPSLQSQQIYQEVVAKDRNERKIKHFLRNSNHFLGRIDEIKQLENYFANCLACQEVGALLLIGDTGIGKRTLARQVLANQTQTFQIVTAKCFREEAMDSLLPWRNILDGLGDLVIQNRLLTTKAWKAALKRCFPVATIFQEDNNQPFIKDHTSLLVSFIVDILQHLAEIKALVILIEDCHWMDEDSLTLLQRVMNQLVHYPIAFVLTKHLGTTPELGLCLNALMSQGRLESICLEPFNRQESLAYINSQLGSQPVTEEEMEHLYQASQGNPFFLSEYTQALLRHEKFVPLTPAIKAKLGLKLANLSSRDDALLNYLSCCRRPIPLNTLAQLMLLPLEEVIEMVDNLGHYYILVEESVGEEVLISFRQRIIQLYSYDRLSLSKRRLLHGQIAKRLEDLLPILTPSPHLLDDIAYHYQESRQVIKALEYHLNYLDATLPFQHELFPIYSKNIGSLEKSDRDHQRLMEEQFDKIRQSIADLELTYDNNRDFQQLLIRFSYLEGRYDIRTGRYQEGIKHIQKVIALATELKQPSFLLEGYRQLIHYCIQVENKPEMRYYTSLSLEAAVAANHFEAIAISLRLNGLYHLIIGELNEAERLLQQSIAFFKVTPGLQANYAIQIAAALDYLGEIAQIRYQFEKAVTYQKQAIALTENKPAELSVSIFYIGLGISYFYLADFEQAEQILSLAKEALVNHSYPWKETQLEIYLAMIQWKKGNYQPALTLLDYRETLMSRYRNPRDKGLVFYLMAVVKYQLIFQGATLSQQEKEMADHLLSESFEYYYEIASTNLNPYRDCHLVSELDGLRQQFSSNN
ncbi:TPA: AAA family ATPase [Streptococcus pyogenes]|uniref:AAA family ATPase n=1 Tax=Streptococcus pyogenes TaxID=1314 RepID=UPI0010A0FD23|nr:AAA family ATPase [Streptococcus pyogenes]VGS31963.1 tetratricopeptide repeat family protein [Streptococcus pyogenes]VGS38111.1 tetratricopeptide repeat family protein [Streptococcus pyogenes]VGS43031.1 tetratricopeptide repeat family protein [Streptococcus pyogenes]VGT39267.1 tetratricopeptide repeat family protein [Streptococcus pyogenes]VGT44767.1 tetratricopeptide repeat family protein [Streptococcus pyogenes]